MSPKLVLFDIDGILVKTDVITVDYWKIIAKNYFGIDVSKDDVYREGKTDRQILVELLKNKGLRVNNADKRLTKALQNIEPIVAEALAKEGIEKIPNVERLVRKLHNEKSITIGLLTGNTFGKAKTKLQAAGLWKYFKVGAFGDSTTIRSKLIPIAIRNAKKTGVKFRKKDVFLIGDTIRDIRCAKEAGVKIIAIATGKESLDLLKRERPDYLFEDFSNKNIDKIVEILKHES